MLILILVFTHLIIFILGWWLCSKATQAYIRQEVMQERTPFVGDELARLKRFVGYKEHSS